MVKYTKVNVRLSDSQLKKLKDAVSNNNTGTNLRISLKMFNGNNLPHELLLTTRLTSGNTTLIISNEEMNDIMKIVQALEDSNILFKGVTDTVKNEAKEQKGGFLSILLGTLGASLLGNLLTGKGFVRASYGNNKVKSVVRAGYRKNKGKGVVRAGYGNQLNSKVDF